MELLFAFLSFALVIVAVFYWDNEIRRNRSGFPKTRERVCKTWICRRD
jgi:hypothetical protein